ncbi:pyruvate dehydrogenase E1 component [Pseudomonas fluorescens]|uniref:Pyruvate dehydrogenase E1 component n=1 Tax=Pseudomonas fluorescens TaxID=294 RepID=A0A379ID75_PSEFL|nr:pyruvate dehydrogenase E1 component [Pseudomonas fluorescens]
MTASTAQSAQICIDILNDQPPPRSSPLYTVMAMANTLEFSPATRRQAWVIRGQSSSRRIAAWPTWFARNSGEKPLLYLHSATSSAQLCALSRGTEQRGILCNDIQTRPTTWPRGAHPSLPLWLASNPQCTPYDPASGEETRAIVLAGLHALYIDGRPGFYYLALHDQDDGPGLAPQDREDAIKGMYRIGREPAARLQVRLLGAGYAFAEVLHAARLLETDWNVSAQLWSCPSYTRLAREARAAERWNRLHPLAEKRSSHLRDCLAGNDSPVIAVTGYPQSVVDPLAAHVDARFVALGAGSVQPAPPDRYWIAALALKALAEDGRIEPQQVERALRRYPLG